MPIKRIDFDVHAFILSLNKKQFSISVLHEAYLASQNCQHNNSKSSRQFIYRSLKKLQEQGLLQCLPLKGSKANQYTLIENVAMSDNIEDISATKLTSNHNIKVLLHDKIKKYKLELLKTIGETEAYKELAEEMPKLRSEIQDHYNSAKDECAKLLGKVNAYESLLVKYQHA